MRFTLTVSLLVLLSACATNPSATGGPGLYTIPIGSILQLNQSLSIPARKARTGVQYGKASIGVDPWYPYCEFLVNTIDNTRTTLPAGDYKVTKIRRAQIPYAKNKSNGGQMVASAGASNNYLSQAASPSYSWLYKTTISLESTVHPDIRQMECGSVFSTGYDARHITIKEFEILAGDVMTLNVMGK